MLSRVAERMYWFGRYIERAENTARLISVNTNLILDLPDAGFVWESLISITGFETEFSRRFSRMDERNVVRFLLDDPTCSIRHSVRMARENARTSREIMSNDAWQKVNELSLYLQREATGGIRREGRDAFLANIINQCYELTGYLTGSMSMDDAYNFIRLGRSLERADMITRIVDVGCLNLMSGKSGVTLEYSNILWMNVLRSLNAYQMYRQHVRDTVNGEDVVDYLLKDDKFPRAVIRCLREVEECFAQLPRSELPLVGVSGALRRITQEDVSQLLQSGELHAFIDDIQLDLADIHDKVGSTWFAYEV